MILLPIENYFFLFKNKMEKTHAISPKIKLHFFFFLSVFYYSNIGMINRFLDALIKLDSELDPFRNILDYLETYPFTGKKNLGVLCRHFKNKNALPSSQLRKIKFVTAAIGLRMNPGSGPRACPSRLQ